MNQNDLLSRLFEVCGTSNLKEVSRLTKVSYDTLKNYRDKKRKPSMDVLIQIAKETNANLNYLMLGEGSHKRTSANARITDLDSLDVEIPSFCLRVKILESGESIIAFPTGMQPITNQTQEVPDEKGKK